MLSRERIAILEEKVAKLEAEVAQLKDAAIAKHEPKPRRSSKPRKPAED